MAAKLSLLATLSSIAMAGVALTPTAASAQADPFFGLVTQLAESCLVEAPPGTFTVATSPARIAACCAVITQVGTENMDFLQAVALADRGDPRLIVLDPQLVEALLSCRQQALDRLAMLAMNVVPAAGPLDTQLYTG